MRAHQTDAHSRRTPWRKRGVRLLAFVLGLGLVVYVGNDGLRLLEPDAPSRSVGSRSDGRLEAGKRMPSRGAGFSTYSRLGSLLGRTATHSRVREVVLDAYAAVHAERPGTRYIYGEMGWPGGGRFYPHRTHQTGLSVDFMVPVLDGNAPAALPTHALNAFGIAFDAEGRDVGGDLRIDFEALADHSHHLDEAARANGVEIAL